VKRGGAARIRGVLLEAAAYNVLWGAFVVLFSFALFRSLGMELPNYPGISQHVGMIVGVYGVGCAVAALDPLRHWPIVLVGLLGKVFGPVGRLRLRRGGRGAPPPLRPHPADERRDLVDPIRPHPPCFPDKPPTKSSARMSARRAT